MATEEETTYNTFLTSEQRETIESNIGEALTAASKTIVKLVSLPERVVGAFERLALASERLASTYETAMLTLDQFYQLSRDRADYDRSHVRGGG